VQPNETSKSLLVASRSDRGITASGFLRSKKIPKSYFQGRPIIRAKRYIKEKNQGTILLLSSTKVPSDKNIEARKLFFILFF